MSGTAKPERKLVGHANFKRNNPMSDKFTMKKFHHLEFYCSDATNTSRRFGWGLGMTNVAKSDLSTGNKTYASFVMKSNELVFVFTAPYNSSDITDSNAPHPNYNTASANKFVIDHGLAVKACGIEVEDTRVAFATAVANGAVGVTEPVDLTDRLTGKVQTIAEIKYFGDTIIRFVSGEFEGFQPNYDEVKGPEINYGLQRLDHAVSNVPNLFDAIDFAQGVFGFHEFSEFTAEDVGTVDSGLNSMVLASNNEMILLPINEPTHGTRRKSQIQTYLEYNNGPGFQHLALKTDDIFETMKELKKRSHVGGFDFMPSPSHQYYEKMPGRIGADALTQEQIDDLEKLGLLADRDDQGVLLQVFSKPIGDRPTIFVEIIQRIGCDKDSATGTKKPQTAGCGGFGKGNFSELFKSIEDFEKQQEDAVKQFKAAAAASAAAGDSK